MYSLILPRWEKRCQIIVAPAASLAPVDVVFAADHVLVWAEAGIGTAAHLLDRCQALVGAVDTPAGIARVVVDLPAAQP
jgi:hypothetical protein